ncbi:sulfotransferase domain-containing protein [Membranihabitans maritimus]|uniref:sulfotransferase domain-containing protein n=1 Tax=Membranihabitans maritimus TaxID=2904244 RepID=UPI001F029CE0|nr:sulfotransferase domain-containing protein [Membranihabitans maritimus]
MKTLAIFSVPRSGSSWLGNIFNSSNEVNFKFQPNFAYSFPYNLTPNSTKKEIYNFHSHLLSCKDPFVNGELSISGKKNKNFDTNSTPKLLVWKEVHYLNIMENLMTQSNIKIIGLIRSPLGIINSWLQAPKEFDPNWSIKKEWKNAPSKNGLDNKNYFGYAAWKETCFNMLKLSIDFPNNFTICSYNQLISDPFEITKNLFEFANLNYSKEVKSYINKSTSNQDNDPYSTNKIKLKDDSWEKGLPKYIIEDIQNDPNFKSLNKIFNWI